MEQLAMLPNRQMHISVWKCIIRTVYLLHVSLLMWPSWGRCITMDRYIRILQKFLDCADIQY